MRGRSPLPARNVLLSPGAAFPEIGGPTPIALGACLARADAIRSAPATVPPPPAPAARRRPRL